jgi:hypothetical protein
LKRKTREKIKEAADVLGLGEKATLAEIKGAYRRLSKKHHPDVQGNRNKKAEQNEMHKLSEAYQILLQYCSEYRFSFLPEDTAQLEGEDWWFERFGHDHHWGDGCAPQEDAEE